MLVLKQKGNKLELQKKCKVKFLAVDVAKAVKTLVQAIVLL